MKFIAAANWKMNKNPQEAKNFFQDFTQYDLGSDIETVFFVPSLVAETTSQSLSGSQIHWGLQNIYYQANGAFTGENSPQVAFSLGATYVLVGHSERRALFGETDEDTNKKIKSAVDHGLSPMLCIGESLEQRQAGETLEVLKRQLLEGLNDIEIKNQLHVAYEPVWAIGTGEVATVEQVSQAHQFIRQTLAQLFPQKQKEICILYGGSVKPGNAAELAKADEVSGFLVGGASLNSQSFFEIVQAARG